MKMTKTGNSTFNEHIRGISNKALCRTIAQLRTNQSLYLHKVDASHNPSRLYPKQVHDTTNLFNCTHVPTQLTVVSSCIDSMQVVPL